MPTVTKIKKYPKNIGEYDVNLFCQDALYADRELTNGFSALDTESLKKALQAAREKYEAVSESHLDWITDSCSGGIQD